MHPTTSAPLEADCIYHIYSRGINSGLIFKNRENYEFFLARFHHYIDEYADLLAYCLMPNHYHFLIRIKSQAILDELHEKKAKRKKFSEGLHAPSSIVSKKLASFFNSYTQAYNKKFERHGALIESPFRRKPIKTDKYLKNVIVYIHQNPLDIGVKQEDYMFCSFNDILKNNFHFREFHLELFEDLENYLHVHKLNNDIDPDWD